MDSTTPIAICGMGVRLPGGIRSSKELFQFLYEKRDARNTVPADRYNVDAYYDEAGKPGFVGTKYGYYLDVDLAEFDESMFRLSKTELASMDPSQRLLLEVTREAFESAGEAEFRGKNIGTFVGDFTEDWQDLQNADHLNAVPYGMTGKSDFVLSNRLAFEYDLQGPSVSIKTACSATAEAVHQAVLSIQAGSCPSAIVAGANIILTPRISMGMTQIGVLAPDGNCKTFDASANGFGRGESVCALYLKRLDDALRDGNPVRAVIRACDSNADGGDGSRTFGTPNAKTQETLMRQTYRLAGLPLHETKVVELHGTGTPVGDPLETTAVAACFGGDETVYIGSVKPNVGHGEGASALTSIIKSVLALENRTILPNIKFNKPNPKIPWDRNLTVPVEPTAWPEGIKERISINSFGLGGSNVHMVIDSAASMGVVPQRRLEAAPTQANGHGHLNGNGEAVVSNGHATEINGHHTNGDSLSVQAPEVAENTNGVTPHTNGHSNGDSLPDVAPAIVKGPEVTEKVNGANTHTNGHTNGTNGHINGHVNGVNGSGTVLPVPRHKGLLLLSASSAPALTKMAANYGEYLKQHPENMDSLVYTLTSRRERLKLGSYCIADGSNLSEPAPASESQNARDVAFIFTGQGAQWVGMGREMMQEDNTFIASIRNMDAALQSLEHAPSWTLEELLLADKADSELLSPVGKAQPICTAVQVAYVDSLAEWNIRPAAVVGHSSGEIGAAYAAGILSAAEAITTAYYRGYACERSTMPPGGMAAVGLGIDAVQPYLKPGVVMACENSNASVTISGDLDALDKTIDDLKAALPDAFVRKLRVPTAYHSHHMKVASNLYGALLAPHLSPKAPTVPFFSTVYGRQVLEAKVFGPQYWQTNLTSPVLFRTGAAQMLADTPANTAHLEIGPHSALAGPLRQIYKEAGRTAPYAAVSDRGHDASNTFLSAIGKLHCFGLSPRVSPSRGVRTLSDLPSYPWNYEGRHWSESRVMAGWRFRKHRRHELLGYRILESGEDQPAWRNVIRLNEVPWLADHCVEKDVVFPAAGYIATAGTAVKQLTDSTAYTVRDVNIATALLLTEGKSTETITTLRRHALTVSNDSKWWEFCISSENNGTWTKHCWGLVTDGCAVPVPAAGDIDVSPHTRVVDEKRWYNALGRIGLHYSNRFVGLDDITASPVTRSASARMSDRQVQGEDYALHPSTLDLVLQSWSVAIAKGQTPKLDKLFLPTFIEEFYVGDAGTVSTLRVRTTSHGRVGNEIGASIGVVDGGVRDREVAYQLKGFEAATMATSQDADELKYMSIQWHPALNLTDPAKLIRPTRDVTSEIIFAEQFGLLCAAEIHEEVATVDSLAEPFFQHFVDGVATHMARIDRGESNIPEAQELKALSREVKRQKIEQWREESKHQPIGVINEAVWRVYHNIRDLLLGNVKLIDVLLEGGMLQRFYDETISWSNTADFFRVLGLNKPQIRILEIGSGTGSTSNRVLTAMHSEQGERLCGEYTITDVSSGFVNQAKERFSNYSNVKYAVCDIEVDPLAQGFEAGSYDLIIAANVLHATSNLVNTLTRCRSLLKPDGHIFLQEFCGKTRHPDLIMGLFEGWWAGVNDGRVERPVVPEDEWDAKLRASGFQGIKTTVRDGSHPDFFCTANMYAQASSDITSVHHPADRVTLLKDKAELDAFGAHVKTALEAAGHVVDERLWGSTDSLPEDQPIVSLIDVDASRPPVLADVNADDLTILIDLLGEVSGQALLWCMRPAQTEVSEPHNGQISGLARCVRAELAMDFVTLELDRLDEEASQAVAKVLGEVQRARRDADENDSLDIDSEYVCRDGQILLSRIHVTPVDEGLTDASPKPDAWHLAIGQPGMLQTMHWSGHSLPALAPDYVQVRMRATGLNFHDVAVAIGIVAPDGDEEKDGYHCLGSEGLAEVTAIGADVKHVAVGDRVVFMDITTPCFATEQQLPAELVTRAPSNVSDEDAAGLVIPYATVLWSFYEKAHLKKGQSVLIHSAAGGVGIAAINLARMTGAEIYCTVGSEAKIDFLVNELGVPRDRIFNSRNDSFLADVMRATNGVGVDVVLNSLSGELLHASWKCVSAGGSMLDIGKRDFLGRGQLAMNPFVENRSLFGVDLASMIISKKHLLVEHLRDCVKLIEANQIAPLRPTTVFEADRVQDAFRYMQKGVHMGRIVVRIPQETGSLPHSIPLPTTQLDPEAAYLMAGGLGGLGRAILTWMAEHGARHLTVFSPSAGKRPEHQQFVEELHEMGCELVCMAGDVADYNFVQEVITTAKGPTGDRPIRGCMQLAMQIRDAGVLNMNHEDWTTVLKPKAQGTMNLHRLLPAEIDFLVLCGSTGGTLGAYGQANYAAANAYLDSFVKFRHSQGLPAAVLDIAAVGDIGYVADNKNVAERLGRQLSSFICEGDFLRGVHLVVERSSGKYVTKPPTTEARSQVVAFENLSQVILFNDTTLPLSDARNPASFRRDPRLAVFRNLQESSSRGESESGGGLRSFLTSLATEPERLDDAATPLFLAEEISRRIYTFLMRGDAEVDVRQTLTSMGADSLVAIEIRNWWKQTLGIEITVLELTDPGTSMEMLGELAVQRLKERNSSK